jgi:hypothetical protein
MPFEKEDFQKLKVDPRFQSLPFDGKKRVWERLDPKFGGLSEASKSRVMNALGVGALPDEKPLRTAFSEAAHAVVPPVAAAVASAGTAGAGVAATPLSGGASGPLGIAAAPVAGAMAFAGTEQLLDRLDEIMGLREPGTLPEVAGEAVEDVTAGAAQELGGQFVKTGAAVVGAERAAGKALAAKAAKEGVKLTPAQLLRYKPLAFLESVAEKFPLTAKVMEKFKAREIANLDASAERTIETIGSVTSREARGAATEGGIMQKYFKRLKVRDKLFDKLTKAVPDGKQLDLSKTSEVAKTVLQNQGETLQGTQNEVLKKYLEAYTSPARRLFKGTGVSSMLVPETEGAAVPRLSFQGAKAQRDQLSDLIGPVADTPEKQIYKRLKNALEFDIADFAEAAGGKILSAYKKANAFHGAVKELQNNPAIQGALKSHPAEVVQGILAKNSPQDFLILRKALPEKVYQDTVQRGVLTELFSTRSQTPGDIVAERAPGDLAKTLTKNLQKYRTDVLETALPKGTLKRLQDFAEVTKHVIPSADVSSGNASGTAASLTAALGTSGILTYLFVKPSATKFAGAAAVALTAPQLAELYLSDTGRKLVQEGFKVLPDIAPGASIGITSAKRLAALKAYTGLMNLARGSFPGLFGKERSPLEPPPVDATPQPDDMIARRGSNDLVAASMPAKPLSASQNDYKTGLTAFVQFQKSGRKEDFETAKRSFLDAYEKDKGNVEAQQGLKRVAFKEGRALNHYLTERRK